MKFKRLLTVGLMALFCAATATAASQLNSVQVTPLENSATVNLRTTGSFAHKEYRPDAHMVLVDLSGVTADPAVERAAALNSAVLKGYKLSSYTSASGSEVTRIELTLGDSVSVAVKDNSDGLQILLSSSSGSSKSTVADAVNLPRPVPESAEPAEKNPPVNQVAEISPALSAEKQPGAAKIATGSATIRNISVQRGHGTLDIVIEGPSSASPFLLSNPDRLVLDFKNTVMASTVRNIAVRGRDVLHVRVGRFQAEPPVTRIVIDLAGPRTFDVVPSANQVIIRVKSEDKETSSGPVKPAAVTVEPPLKSAPAPALASVEPPPVAGRDNLADSGLQSSARIALASASPKPRAEDVVMPAAVAVAPVRDQQVSDTKDRAGIAAQKFAVLPQEKTAVEVAQSSRTERAPGSAAPALPAPKYTGEPISVNLKDVDLKDFFRLIHEISGLNVVLDPSVKGTVTLVLDDVPWDQALDIVLRNNSLDRELQGTVLRIAAADTLRREAVERRAQSEAVALAVDRQTVTRFLSYAKAKDAVPTIKKFLTARGDVISDERTNALIISDIPSVLPTLDRLISQLDRKTQEVEIEVRVVSAARSFSRDLGFQLGFNWGNGVTTVGGSNPTAGQSSSGGGGSTNTSSVPLFSNIFSNFGVTTPTTGLAFSNITKNYGVDAILTAAEAHNLAKVLSRPRVVTQSNVKAEVKQGTKLPVYTASTSNANSSVTYIDAVLRLSVLPQITADNTIFLTVDVENTQQAGQASNGNYVLTTQQATTQVLVTDGGTVVIGGVIQTTNTVSTSQTPFLGDIPLLGNLFKVRSVSTETRELIFFITPKIIET
ncbi:MAG: hypothetical protein CXZ00_09160 [Acidobacteria bacterium]|nr:MAG: hypothetical protein CXZ00_09160 [Acidobacteriota bacterium]